MSDPLHASYPSRPDIGDDEIRRSAGVGLGWLTTGRRPGSSSTSSPRQIDAKHAIAVNSCTAALHLSLEAAAARRRRGDHHAVHLCRLGEVIPILRRPARPGRRRSETLNIDRISSPPRSARRRGDPPLHLPAWPSTRSISRSRPLTAVIEDAAHAFPTYRNRAIGSIGDLTCFRSTPRRRSQPARGMITTNDDALAELSDHVVARHQQGRLEALFVRRLVVLRDRGARIQVQHDGHRRRARLCAAAESANARRRAEIAQRYRGHFASAGCRCRLPLVLTHAWHLYILPASRAPVDDRAVRSSCASATSASASTSFLSTSILLPRHLWL